ncbi:MAG: maleylpyruvate isomerase family mycothiol-dependent enzyme, partial [Steroidobacteraceae bacterium]
LDGCQGRPLLERWHAGAHVLAATYADFAPDQRFAWAGPDMSARSFMSARQMETWAHGQAVYDLLGLERQDSDRLRNVAVMGVNTFGWSHAVRKREVPAPPPYVRLTGPSGAVWEWNDAACADRVEGTAVDFCRVVTQTRNVLDTALVVRGPVANAWMSIAQCFAGPPEQPPAPGTRFTRR